MDQKSLDLEAMAGVLEASGNYRVLRRLNQLSFPPIPQGLGSRQGLFIDVETTGLNPTSDEVIELAMVPFTYGLDGRIYAVGEAFQKLRQPTRPIPSEITQLTGITDDMVRGQVIDSAEVESFSKSADLVVAHNASFDRQFSERVWEGFASKPWACSMTQIEWKAEGFEGTKLAYLAYEAGFFYEKHRSTYDCLAAISLLAMTLPRSNLPAMEQLLERARRPSCRIHAEGAPFEKKDALRARGYRWSDGSSTRRGWFIDVDESGKESELIFLRAEVYQREVDPPMHEITAYDRFSSRS